MFFPLEIWLRKSRIGTTEAARVKFKFNSPIVSRMFEA